MTAPKREASYDRTSRQGQRLAAEPGNRGRPARARRDRRHRHAAALARIPAPGGRAAMAEQLQQTAAQVSISRLVYVVEHRAFVVALYDVESQLGGTVYQGPGLAVLRYENDKIVSSPDTARTSFRADLRTRCDVTGSNPLRPTRSQTLPGSGAHGRGRDRGRGRGRQAARPRRAGPHREGHRRPRRHAATPLPDEVAGDIVTHPIQQIAGPARLYAAPGTGHTRYPHSTLPGASSRHHAYPFASAISRRRSPAVLPAPPGAKVLCTGTLARSARSRDGVD